MTLDRSRLEPCPPPLTLATPSGASSELPPELPSPTLPLCFLASVFSLYASLALNQEEQKSTCGPDFIQILSHFVPRAEDVDVNAEEEEEAAQE